MDSPLKYILINSPNKTRQAGVKYILENPSDLEELIDMSFSDFQPEGWRAAWVLADLVKNDKQICKKVQLLSSKIIYSFKYFNSSGQIREFLKIIQLLKIEEEDMGLLIDMCFNWLLNRKVDQSFRIYSMQIIYDYSKKEPDLLPELKAIIEQEIEYAKPGFRSRANKILKRMKL